MNLRNLLCACCAAVLTLALAGCPSPVEETKDTGVVVKADTGVVVTGDTGVVVTGDTGVVVTGDTGVVVTGDTGVVVTGDTGTTCTPAQHDANCAGRECGPDGCGGTCGTGCADGKTCNPAGMCVVKTCAQPVGPCGPDQWCDTSGADPACVEICGPTGCLAGETCVHDDEVLHTGHCQPPSCPEGSSNVCKTGQVCGYWGEFTDCTADTDCTGADKCVEFSDGKACSHEECSCEPSYTDSAGTDHEDTCLQYGKVCDMDINDETTIKPAECRLPLEWEDCKTSIGCATPADGGKLDCLALSGGGVCLRNCLTGSKPDTKKCLDAMTMCYPSGTIKNHCYVGFCADPSCEGAPTGCTADGERSKYFKPCSYLGTNDSFCWPYIYSDGSDLGFCIQGGTAPLGGECDPSWERDLTGDYSKLCQPPKIDASGKITQAGELCLFRVEPVTPGAADTKYKGICQPQCNAYTGADRSPAVDCPDANQVCLDYTLDSTVKFIWPGTCVTKCDLFGTDQCADDVLGNHQGCGPTYDFQGNGYCQTLSDTAAGLDEKCVYDDIDPRNTCGDRLTCMQYTSETEGRCTAWCKSAECSDPKAVCASCAGAKCCKPDCANKCSGQDDGCGGKCGCEVGKKCDTTSNTCVACTKDCAGKKCDGTVDDGCGGKCACTSPELCNIADTTNPSTVCYTPDCTGKCNGEDDGHGGKCGCAIGLKCNTTSNTCEACTKDCANKCSGQDDGCGGKCGCEVGNKCVVDTTPDPDTETCTACDLAVQCDGKCSGEDDGCGGKCTCATGKICDTTPAKDVCVDCTPKCFGKSCGPDGCGGTCGTTACGTDEVCAPVGADQKCVPVTDDGTKLITTPVQACDYH